MCIVLSAQIVVTAFTTKYGKEINPHPWPQFLMEAGLRHHASEAGNSEEDRHPHLQGRSRKENRECDLESTVREK